MDRGAMDRRVMDFVSRSLWQGCLRGLDEEVRSLPGFARCVGWPIRLTPGEHTRGWVVVPVAHAIFDFDMAGGDKCIYFVGSAGIGAVPETTLGLESRNSRALGSEIASDEVLKETVGGTMQPT